ncbi:MAG: PEP-CTERM sorting domain-containing protein [Verrucomicrobiota bacterium]
MKTHKKVCSVTAAIIVLSSLVTGANAALNVTSTTSYGFFNESDGFFSDLDSNSSNTGASVSISGNAYDSNYRFSATGMASASAFSKRLRAQASGALNFEDGSEIGSFVDPTPDFYSARGTASFTETLSYGGTATNYSSKYILNFTGTIIGDASVAIALTHAGNPVQFWSFSSPGTYNETLISEAFVHGQSPQDFSLTLESQIDLSTDDSLYPIPNSGNADFGNTLEVVGIELRDNDTGILLTGDSVMGESGSTYAITQIPEPSSALLLGLGCACLAFRRSGR